MTKVRAKLLRPVFCITAALAGAGLTAPADAREWVAAEAPSPGWRLITYRSESLLPGGQATLTYFGRVTSPTESGFGIQDDATVNIFALSVRLNIGDAAPISGFDGVWLGNSQSDHLVDLFVPSGFWDDHAAKPCHAPDVWDRR